MSTIAPLPLSLSPEPATEPALEIAPEPAAPADEKAAKRRRLGKRLVKRDLVTKAQVREALAEQRRTGGRLGEILVARGDLDPASLRAALAKQSGLPPLTVEHEAIELVPRSLAYELRAVAVVDPSRPPEPGDPVLVAVSDLEVVPTIAAALHRSVQPRLADLRTIDALLASAYAHANAHDARVAHSRHRRRRRLELSGGAPLRSGAAAPSSDAAAEGALPTCTILVPLRGAQPAVIERVRTALDGLDYPLHRLQGLALLDADDRVTRRALRTDPLPDWVTRAKVPGGVAAGELLLYGLREARGELIAVVRDDGALGAGALGRAVAATTAGSQALVIADLRRPGGRRLLARRFLREAESSWLEAVTRGGGGMPARPPAVFRTTQLRAAFGWEPAEQLA